MRTLKIGRNPDNDIIIKDDTLTVSGYHAVIKVYDRTFTICDNSTNGTSVNGVKVTKNVDISVKRGDEIRLGPYVLLDWSLVSVSPVHRDAAEIDTDEKASYTIGTDTDNRITIVDPSNYVSRHHAILKLKHDGKYYIYDKSTNGTYVNGVKVKSKVDYPVSTPDTIVFAKIAQLDWNLIIKASILKPAYVAPEPQKPVSSYTPQKAKSNSTSPGKIIGWILIAVGIIGVFNTGISFTFEGICAVSAPVIGGIILIVRAKN